VGVLIDASVFIDAERGRLNLAERVAWHPSDEVFLSVVTASELLHGVHRATTAAQRVRRAAFVEGLLERLPVLDIDLSTARAHARIWADLSAAGTRVGANDLWLAAAALAHGLTVVTGNVREFERVPGLRVEAW
jgi:tRNA(fMet)-specific endonuclease VapC